MQLRLPPQDLEAEGAVLASCLIDPVMADEAFEILSPADFYRGAHQKIFRAIQAAKASGPVDILTVRAALESAGDLEAVGGTVALSNIVDLAGVATSMAHYARMVKDKAMLRALLERSQRIAERCFDGGEASEVLDWAQSQVLGIDLPTTAKWFDMNELSSATLDRIEKAMQGDDGAAVPTMLPTLDRVTGGGLRGGLLGIIAGRPRMGKTSLMTTLAANMARRGECIGVFSIEMPKEEIDLRWLSMMTGINTVALRAGHRLVNGRRVPLAVDDWEKIATASDRKSRWRILVDDTAGLRIQELKRRARMMVKSGARVVFIDQLSKIRGGEGKTIFEQNSNIVNELAELKKELGIPVILLAQVGRKAEDRSDKVPGLADLKMTGSLEEDADIIIIVHREFEYSGKPEHEREALIHVAKHRNGPEWRIQAAWDAQRTMFYEEAQE